MGTLYDADINTVSLSKSPLSIQMRFYANKGTKFIYVQGCRIYSQISFINDVSVLPLHYTFSKTFNCSVKMAPHALESIGAQRILALSYNVSR